QHDRPGAVACRVEAHHDRRPGTPACRHPLVLRVLQPTGAVGAHTQVQCHICDLLRAAHRVPAAWLAGCMGDAPAVCIRRGCGSEHIPAVLVRLRHGVLLPHQPRPAAELAVVRVQLGVPRGAGAAAVAVCDRRRHRGLARPKVRVWPGRP
ncbi:hypothetical protein EC988_008195, partial [Linderina pennispora]